MPGFWGRAEAGLYVGGADGMGSVGKQKWYDGARRGLVITQKSESSSQGIKFSVGEERLMLGGKYK